MYFDNEINTTYKYNRTCLSKLRSTGIPAIRNKLIGTDFSRRISPLKSGNLAVRHRIGNLGRVKVNFLRTMNVTVADPAGRSYRYPVQFFGV